jgi:hypothetical protein
MQAWPGDNQRGSSSQRPAKIALYTILCFSLAGLIAGFALGGFTGRAPSAHSGGSGPAITRTPSIVAHSPNPSATRVPENVLLGVPLVGAGDYTGSEKADGTTTYTFSAQIVNKAGNTPITATDVTCRLWLTEDANAMAAALSNNNYALPRTPSSFDQPFPHETANALNFAPSSPQTQPCSAQGKTSWTYTLAPSLHHGTYFLAVLADWKGIHYNWAMVEISVSKGNNG